MFFSRSAIPISSVAFICCALLMRPCTPSLPMRPAPISAARLSRVPHSPIKALTWASSSLDTLAELSRASSNTVLLETPELPAESRRVLVGVVCWSGARWIPPSPAATWASSWAIRCCPSLVSGLYAPSRKYTSCPRVKARAESWRLARSAPASVWRRTPAKLAPRDCSMDPIRSSGRGVPIPPRSASDRSAVKPATSAPSGARKMLPPPTALSAACSAAASAGSPAPETW